MYCSLCGTAVRLCCSAPLPALVIASHLTTSPARIFAVQTTVHERSPGLDFAALHGFLCGSSARLYCSAPLPCLFERLTSDKIACRLPIYCIGQSEAFAVHMSHSRHLTKLVPILFRPKVALQESYPVLGCSMTALGQPVLHRSRQAAMLACCMTMPVE